jgi:hypothetical protein
MEVYQLSASLKGEILFNKAEGEAAIRSFEITQIKFISTISMLSDGSEMLRASNRGK